MVVVGCDSFEFTETYTLIEVRSSTTGEAIVGVDVTAGVVDRGSEYVDAIVAPTDSHGQTLIPVRVVAGTQAPLRITVNDAGYESTLSVTNRDGSVAEDGRVVIALLSADAEAPSPPLLAPIFGSNPPRVEVVGYVRALNVCDNRVRRAEWELLDIGGIYLDTAVVGQVPPGYEDTTINIHLVPPERTLCWAEFDGIMLPESGFSICAISPFGNEWICGGRYCLGTQGEAIPCQE